MDKLSGLGSCKSHVKVRLPTQQPWHRLSWILPEPFRYEQLTPCGSSNLFCCWAALMFNSILFLSPNVDSIAVVGQDLLGAEGTEMSTHE